MSSILKQIKEYQEIAEKNIAAKEEAKKAVRARINEKKHGLYAGSRPKSKLVKGINRLRLIEAFSKIGKERIVEDHELLPKILAENLESNLDYFVLLPRPAIIEANEHGQEVIPVNLSELDEETRQMLELTNFDSEEPKSSEEKIEGEKDAH